MNVLCLLYGYSKQNSLLLCLFLQYLKYFQFKNDDRALIYKFTILTMLHGKFSVSFPFQLKCIFFRNSLTKLECIVLPFFTSIFFNKNNSSIHTDAHVQNKCKCMSESLCCCTVASAQKCINMVQ